ncbi:MAG TPA: HAD family hydrolase [Chloroflexia bacterium]|nr:HAD family hydrolase [Chloroflexia bacterium]
MKIKGVILDVDGTLVDSNDAHIRSWLEALSRHGYNCTYEEIRRLIGMGSDNLLPTAIDVEKDTPEGKRLSDTWSEVFERDYLPNIKAFPRTRDLLLALKARGLKLVVASSAQEDMLDKLLDIAGVKDLLEESTSADDAENSKPDPDIVEASLGKIGLRPSEVLMLGDTPYDIQAARKLGIGTIGLRCGGWDDKGLQGAVAVYDDPADLLARLDDSPLTRS